MKTDRESQTSKELEPKFLEGNRHTSHDLGLGNGVLNTTAEAQVTNGKDKHHLFKTKNFVLPTSSSGR